MIKSLVYIFSLSFFSACSYTVGGECNYKSTQGVVLIKSKNQNICLAQFTPKQVNYDIELTCNDDVIVGKSYSAILKKRAHGSCTPIILNLVDKVQ